MAPGDADGGARAAAEGVLGVRDQVQEDLDELVLVRHGGGGDGGEVDGHAQPFTRPRRALQPFDVADDFGEVDGGALGGAGAGHEEQVANDVAGALGLLTDDLELLAEGARLG